MRDFVRAIGDRYRLGKLLGAGGWGSVFAAESVQSGQRVAVKVLSDDQGDARGRERFLQEIAIAGRLAHPGIVPMLDSGEAAGRLYYVMPLIEGPTLQMRLADEPQLPVDDAIQIASAVLDALAHAHAAGVVHRDIKPSNIILAPGGAVVTDFGIARAQSRTGRSALATTTGVTHGTPEYMSPEQAAGARAIDGRSDLYALGVVLYQRPFPRRPLDAGGLVGRRARSARFRGGSTRSP
ncbi:MAG: serine/threonine protein kinase [Gemmatimonadetes bacterium]|nr:serine/threonine protein kinase [Gemmatimonadota bacterium]